MPGVAEFRRGERTSMRSDSDLSSELAETRRRLAELEAAEADRRDAETIQGALYRIAELASAAQDMQEFYGAVHAVVGELMYADDFFIALFDEERQLISWPYWEDEVDVDWPAANTWVDFDSRQSRGTTAYVLRTGEPQWLPRERQEELIAQGEFELWGEMSEDWLGVPLTSEGRTVGALVVQSYTKESTYTEQDKELLAYVGQHVGAALSRARAIEETRQRVAELATVNSVGQAVAAQLDLDALIELVGEQVRETFDADIAYVALLDQTSERIEFAYYSEGGARRHETRSSTAKDSPPEFSSPASRSCSTDPSSTTSSRRGGWERLPARTSACRSSPATARSA